MQRFRYFDLMIEGNNYIELRLDLSEPAELHDLVGAFIAIGNQFEQYLRDEHPSLVDEASRIYVKQIRAGSIIADLVPFIQPLIENMDRALIVDGFVRRYGAFLRDFIKGNRKVVARKSDLDDFLKAVTVIAKDPSGTATISAAEFHQTKATTRASISFDTKDARKAVQSIEQHKVELEAKAFQIVENQLMVFFQSNLREPETGKRTGELAIIEYVTKKPLAVVYDSTLAEERIKHETAEGTRNIYKLGFYVTCRVERLSDRPVAYRISEVHEIIELPDSDD